MGKTFDAQDYGTFRIPGNGGAQGDSLGVAENAAKERSKDVYAELMQIGEELEKCRLRNS